MNLQSLYFKAFFFHEDRPLAREIATMEILKRQQSCAFCDQNQAFHSYRRRLMARKLFRTFSHIPEKIHIWLRYSEYYQPRRQLWFLALLQFPKLHQIHRRPKMSHLPCTLPKELPQDHVSSLEQSLALIDKEANRQNL